VPTIFDVCADNFFEQSSMDLNKVNHVTPGVISIDEQLSGKEIMFCAGCNSNTSIDNALENHVNIHKNCVLF